MKKLLTLLTLLLCSSILVQLRAEESITLRLSPQYPTSIKLKVVADGSWSIEGVEEEASTNTKKTPYTPTGETITLRGNIKELDCSSASLIAINLSTSSKLRRLNCSLNAIKTLDLSHHKELDWLDCNSNQLTSLSLDQNQQLTYLDCGRNKIQSMNLSCSKLEEFNCGGNLLTELNLASCVALYTVMCHDNKIKGNGMKRMIENLPMSAMEGGILVIIDTTAPDEGNVCTKEQVAMLKKKQWDAYNWNGGNYEQYLGSDGVEPLQSEKIRFSTTKSVGEKILITIDGSSDIAFTGLQEAPVVRGQGATEYTLTSQEVSIEGSLISLFFCTAGGITQADFSQAPSLLSLNVSSNALTTLDLSSQEKLQQLHCGINKLEEINIAPLVDLQWFNCAQNDLSSLDLSHNNKLSFLNCATNKLSELQIAGESLNAIFCYGNQIKTLDLSGCPALARLEAFENRLEELDISQSPNLELLYCGSNLLPSLDLSNNTKLRELGCGNNLLKELDLSQHTNLSILYSTDNQLHSLKLSPKATFLERIDCYHNQLTGLAMDAFIASLPVVSTDDYEELYLYDSTSSSEGNKATSEQIQMIKEKNWNIYDQHGEDPIDLSSSSLTNSTFQYTFNASHGVLSFSGAKARAEYHLYDINGLLITSIATDDQGSASLSLPSIEGAKYIVCGEGETHLLMAF